MVGTITRREERQVREVTWSVTQISRMASCGSMPSVITLSYVFHAQVTVRGESEICWILTTVRYLWSKVNDDREPAAVVSVVGQRRAEARRPALTGVRATLLVETRRAEVLVAGREQILVQYVTHLWGIGHWEGEEAGRQHVTHTQKLWKMAEIPLKMQRVQGRRGTDQPAGVCHRGRAEAYSS